MKATLTIVLGEGETTQQLAEALNDFYAAVAEKVANTTGTDAPGGGGSTDAASGDDDGVTDDDGAFVPLDKAFLTHQYRVVYTYGQKETFDSLGAVLATLAREGRVEKVQYLKRYSDAGRKVWATIPFPG